MKIETSFDRIHSWIIEKIWLQRFTAFTRILLAVGFIPPSIKKILGEPFTILPDSTPVGHYFNALYQTGFYYQFIGWGQLIAAVLLIFPRTAHLGALIFFPIILNITVLTNSVDFAGTKYITILMLLAATFLVCWDYDRWKSLLFSKRRNNIHLSKLEFLTFPVLFSLAGVAGISFLAYFSIGNLDKNYLRLLPFAAFGGFVFGFVCALHHKFMRVGQLRDANTETDLK